MTENHEAEALAALDALVSERERLQQERDEWKAKYEARADRLREAARGDLLVAIFTQYRDQFCQRVENEDPAEVALDCFDGLYAYYLAHGLIENDDARAALSVVDTETP